MGHTKTGEGKKKKMKSQIWFMDHSVLMLPTFTERGLSLKGGSPFDVF